MEQDKYVDLGEVWVLLCEKIMEQEYSSLSWQRHEKNEFVFSIFKGSNYEAAFHTEQ